MENPSLTYRSAPLIAILVLSIGLLASLVLMGRATQNSDRFGDLYSILLLTNTVGLFAFAILIGINLKKLISDLRQKTPGARLNLRMLLLFVVLAVTPVLVVYSFSLDFLRRGIDSWFDVRIEAALASSLELGKEALDARMRELLAQTERVADELTSETQEKNTLDLDLLRSPGGIIAATAWMPESAQVDALRERSGARELTILGSDGKVMASSIPSTQLMPHLPPEITPFRILEGRNHISLDPTRDGELTVRVAVNVELQQGERILYAVYPFPQQINYLADEVESAFAQYNELGYLRDKLKISFAMTLTMVLLFSIAAAVWAAFYSARRLSAPIRDLAKGTAEVAAGNYETNLPVENNDEIGFLIHSFNEMTKRISQARDIVESQHSYIDAVLKRLTSGVITTSETGEIVTINSAAVRLLEIQDESFLKRPLNYVIRKYEHLTPLSGLIEEIQNKNGSEWEKQVVIFASDGRRELMCRGTSFQTESSRRIQQVIVLEDVTALIQGQRDAAWSEVARRLAHEIKNPLTPIQLATERLRIKYGSKLDAQDTEVTERLTNTITQQVETMKSMVNTFSDYAKKPESLQDAVQINTLISNVLDLFRNAYRDVSMIEEFACDLPPVFGDERRLRQVLNNLIKNAVEACNTAAKPLVIIRTGIITYSLSDHIEMQIENNGERIPESLVPDIFEPYVTSKSRGTGLGLAIVKKIVEEHNGIVTLKNKENAGVLAIIRLPLTHVPDRN